MNRLKIAIETSTSCVGKCVGCVLTPLEKSSSTPPIKATDLKDFFTRVAALYEGLLNIDGKNHEMVVIELVIGEHFSFNDDYFHSLCKEIKVFLTGTQRSYIVAISTSGLMAETKMLQKISILGEYFSKSKLEVHLVCNLNQFARYRDKYEKSLQIYKTYFGHINILTNFDNQLEMGSCNLFSKFLARHKITDVQLVYGLKSHNFEKISESKKLFFQVHEKIFNALSPTHRAFDISEGLNYCDETTFSMKELICNASEKIVNKQVFISHTGDIHYILPTMIGGIELDSRAGFSPITNIFNSNFVEEYISSRAILARDLLKIFIKSNICISCEHSGVCYSTGVPLLKDLIFSKDSCHNPLLPFYENKTAIKEKYDYIKLEDWSKKFN